MSCQLVCNFCLEEEGMREFIALCGEDNVCSFCNRQSTCLPIECVIDHIMKCLEPYYTNDPEGIYDGEEGIFWEQEDPRYILSETVFDGCDKINDDIFEELLEGFGEDIWTKRDPYGEDYWWEEFSEFVKYERRYFFLEQELEQKLEENEPALRGNPKKMLSKTLEICRNLLIRKENLKLFRCRYQKQQEKLDNLEDFLSPPPEKATIANRMNPPGIPYLYAATCLETAFEEVKKEDGIYKIAELDMSCEVNLIDLSNLTPIPSIFHPNCVERIKFNRDLLIHRFAREICKPIARDDRVHIEYVASQILCEYIKEKAPDISGIIYKSNTATHGKNVCLFTERSQLGKIFYLKDIKIKSHPS